jgi:hypothetical protein
MQIVSYVRFKTEQAHKYGITYKRPVLAFGVDNTGRHFESVVIYPCILFLNVCMYILKKYIFCR